MSDISVINNYERRLNQKDTEIKRLREQNAIMEQELHNLGQQVEHKTNIINERQKELERQRTEKNSHEVTIEKLKRIFHEGQQRFKELYSTSVDLSEPSHSDLAMLVRHHGVELYLRQTKLQIQNNELNNLIAMLARKNQSIAKLISQNQKARQHELEVTTHYARQISGLRLENQRLSMINRSKVFKHEIQTIQNNPPIDISQTYEEILRLKDSQIANLRAQHTKSRKEIKELLQQIRQIQCQKEQNQNILMDGGFNFEDVLVQNAKLKQQNEKARADVQSLKQGFPDLEDYRNKIKKQLESKQKWVAQEKRIAELQTELSFAESKYNLSVEIIKAQNKKLRQNENGLTRQTLALQLIVQKMNKAFKIMNPYFDIYQYDLAGLNKNEINRLKNLDGEVAYSIRLNELESRELALNLARESHNSQLQKAKKDCVNFRKELFFYKDLVKNNFWNGKQNKQQSNPEDNSILSSSKTISSSSQIQQKCVEIIRELMIRIERLQRSYNQVLVKFNLLQSDYNSYRNTQRVTPRTFVDIPQIPPAITLQQAPMPSTTDTWRVQLTQMSEQISRLKSMAAETTGTIASYNKGFADLQIALSLMKKSQHDLKQEKDILQERLKANAIELQQLKAKSTLPAQLELKQSAVVPERSHSMISIPQLEEKGNVSEESIKRLSQLIDSNIQLLDHMQTEYVSLKANYQKTSQALVANSHTISQDTLLQNQILKQKLSQAAARISASDAHEKSYFEQNFLLKSENARLHQAINAIQASRERQNEIQKTRQQAIMEQVTANLKQRQGILMSSYTPGLDSAGDTKLIKALTELVQDKNKRIDVLEERLIESIKTTEVVSAQNVLTNSEQQNLADLLDRAAEMIQALQNKD